MNRRKLIESCTTSSSEGIKINTKTKHAHSQLTDTTYKREPLKEIIEGDRQWTKTLILTRHGMLECGANYKGTMQEKCNECNVVDNEHHRLNDCTKFAESNRANMQEKHDFRDVYSTDANTLKRIVGEIGNIWEFRYANGRMKKSC